MANTPENDVRDTINILIALFNGVLGFVNFFLYRRRRTSDRRYIHNSSLYKVLILDKISELLKSTDKILKISNSLKFDGNKNISAQTELERVEKELDDLLDTIRSEFCQPIIIYDNDLKNLIERKFDNFIAAILRIASESVASYDECREGSVVITYRNDARHAYTQNLNEILLLISQKSPTPDETSKLDRIFSSIKNRLPNILLKRIY